jgi:hypothetical protein
VGKSNVREDSWRELPENHRYSEKISFRQLKMLVQAFFIFNSTLHHHRASQRRQEASVRRFIGSCIGIWVHAGGGKEVVEKLADFP